VNGLIRDMGLTKSNVELLISRMKQWNLVKEDVQVTSQKLDTNLSQAFILSGLASASALLTFVPKEWRLFIDGSTTSLKAVLLHNGNKIPTLL